MKKNRLLIPLGIATMVFAGTAYGMDIYKSDIPDETFRQYLFASFDQNNDGVLSDAERNDVTEIIVDDYGVIQSVRGIEYFPHLKCLMCDGNDISDIDVSRNRELEVLTFNHNYVSTIDLSNNVMLAELYCSDNLLENLNVSNNPRLGFLECSDNLLDTLDVSCNSELEMLNCDLSESAIIRTRTGTEPYQQADYQDSSYASEVPSVPQLYDWQQKYYQDMEGVCFGISWTPVPGADGYEVRTAYYYGFGTGNGQEWSDWVYETVSDTYYEVGYSAGAGVKASVRAYDNTGFGKNYSEWSTEKVVYSDNASYAWQDYSADSWGGGSYNSGGTESLDEQFVENTVIEHVRNNYPECGFSDITAFAQDFQGSEESGYYRVQVTAYASNSDIEMEVEYSCSFYENNGDWYLDDIKVEDGDYTVLQFTLTEEDALYYTSSEYTHDENIHDIVLRDRYSSPDAHLDIFYFDAYTTWTQAGFDDNLQPAQIEYEDEREITVSFSYGLYSGWNYGKTKVSGGDMIDLGGSDSYVTVKSTSMYR